MDGLTTWEVQDAISTYDEKARRRFEERNEALDERSTRRAEKRAEYIDPAASADVEIEHADGRTLCRLK
jgi:hypothetical protein